MCLVMLGDLSIVIVIPTAALRSLVAAAACRGGTAYQRSSDFRLEVGPHPRAANKQAIVVLTCPASTKQPYYLMQHLSVLTARVPLPDPRGTHP
jgi:hypothetical protein